MWNLEILYRRYAKSKCTIFLHITKHKCKRELPAIFYSPICIYDHLWSFLFVPNSINAYDSFHLWFLSFTFNLLKNHLIHKDEWLCPKAWPSGYPMQTVSFISSVSFHRSSMHKINILIKIHTAKYHPDQSNMYNFIYVTVYFRHEPTQIPKSILDFQGSFCLFLFYYYWALHRILFQQVSIWFMQNEIINVYIRY